MDFLLKFTFQNKCYRVHLKVVLSHFIKLLINDWILTIAAEYMITAVGHISVAALHIQQHEDKYIFPFNETFRLFAHLITYATRYGHISTAM